MHALSSREFISVREQVAFQRRGFGIEAAHQRQVGASLLQKSLRRPQARLLNGLRYVEDVEALRDHNRMGVDFAPDQLAEHLNGICGLLETVLAGFQGARALQVVQQQKTGGAANDAIVLQPARDLPAGKAGGQGHECFPRRPHRQQQRPGEPSRPASSRETTVSLKSKRMDPV